MKNKKYIDAETGEVVVGAVLTPDMAVNYKVTDLRKMDAWRRSTEAGKELQEFNESVGKNYTFTLRESVNELFANELFNDSERVAIMYIGTFVNYKGHLVSKNNIPIDKKMLKKMVKITTKDNGFNKFYDKLIQSEILKEEINGLTWSSKLSFKGTPKLNDTNIKYCYRTYDQTMQELYENNSPKSLSVVFRLLPYVNRFTNEISRVVEEYNYSTGDLYSPQEIAELLGITDSQGKKDFVRRALKVKVGNQYVFMISKVADVAKVTINPRLVWMSMKAPDHTLTNLFDLAKK